MLVAQNRPARRLVGVPHTWRIAAAIDSRGRPIDHSPDLSAESANSAPERRLT